MTGSGAPELWPVIGATRHEHAISAACSLASAIGQVDQARLHLEAAGESTVQIDSVAGLLEQLRAEARAIASGKNKP